MRIVKKDILGICFVMFIVIGCLVFICANLATINRRNTTYTQQRKSMLERLTAERWVVRGVVDRYDLLEEGQWVAIYFDDGRSMIARTPNFCSRSHPRITQLMIPLHKEVAIICNGHGDLIPDPSWTPPPADLILDPLSGDPTLRNKITLPNHL